MRLLPLLATADLNHLVCFVALFETGSVTRAGHQLGLSQSATSHILAHLRRTFNDPLFIRDGRRMVPTARANDLIGPVRQGLTTLGRTLESPDGFDPATSTRTFQVASVDLFDRLIMPHLLVSVAEQAPGVGVTVARIGPDTMRELEAGELDLAVVPVLADTPSESGGLLRERTLLHDGFRSFVRADHPDVDGLARSRDVWCAARHLLVSPEGRGAGVVDRVLDTLGHQRTVAARVPDFSTALAIVGHTDLVLTAPAALARCIGPTLQTFAPPVDLPSHRVTLRWSERAHRDPGLTWLREQLLDAMHDQPLRPPPPERAHTTR